MASTLIRETHITCHHPVCLTALHLLLPSCAGNSGEASRVAVPVTASWALCSVYPAMTSLRFLSAAPLTPATSLPSVQPRPGKSDSAKPAGCVQTVGSSFLLSPWMGPGRRPLPVDSGVDCCNKMFLFYIPACTPPEASTR